MDMNFDAIICGMSAWHYHATPPILRDTEIPVARAQELVAAGSLRLPKEVLAPRKNARRVDALVSARILTDLKGIPLPIHVMVGPHVERSKGALVHPHALSRYLMPSDVTSLGGGLGVLTPQATLRFLTSELGRTQALLLAFEACGIYAIEPNSQVMKLCASDLQQSGTLTREAARKLTPIAAYSDAQGKPIAHVDGEDSPLPWVPCFNAARTRTTMWKRPPLMSAEEFRTYTRDACWFRSSRANVAACAVASEVHDGAGSPLESRAAILMFSERARGGEHWPWPDLNRTIPFTSEAKTLGNKKQAVADMILEDRRAVFEVNGKAYHADEYGFTVESGRRAALERMGYVVFDITYEHLSNLEAFDALMTTFSTRLEIPLERRNADYLKRRQELHAELFPERY